jgi:hypothetical protein
VPVAAVLKVFVEELGAVYRRSPLFEDAEPPDPTATA